MSEFWESNVQHGVLFNSTILYIWKLLKVDNYTIGEGIN